MNYYYPSEFNPSKIYNIIVNTSYHETIMNYYYPSEFNPSNLTILHDKIYNIYNSYNIVYIIHKCKSCQRTCPQV